MFSRFYVALTVMSKCEMVRANGSEDKLNAARHLAEKALFAVQSLPQSDKYSVSICKIQCKMS